MVALALPAAGCGGTSVQGQVTLDGQPVEWGSISFVPVGNTKGPLTGAVITDGKYAIKVGSAPTVGHYRVEIRWAKKTGK
jgi:hypothetical protein